MFFPKLRSIPSSLFPGLFSCRSASAFFIMCACTQLFSNTVQSLEQSHCSSSHLQLSVSPLCKNTLFVVSLTKELGKLNSCLISHLTTLLALHPQDRGQREGWGWGGARFGKDHVFSGLCCQCRVSEKSLCGTFKVGSSVSWEPRDLAYHF